MAKNAIADFDVVPANNTDIGGIDIRGTAPVQNFDDALRTLMAYLKVYYSTARTTLEIYRRQLPIITPSTNVSAIIIAIPAGCLSTRITGLIDKTTTDAPTLGRLSFNGGASYVSSTTDYVYSGLDQYGSTLTATTNTNTSEFIAALDPGHPGIATQLDCIAIDAMPSKLTRFSSASHAVGLAGQERRYQSHGWARGNVPTHIMLFTATGFFTPNTRLSVEAF